MPPHQRVTLYDLISTGFLHPGQQFTFDGHMVTLMANGDLHTPSSDHNTYLRSSYASLSSWCSDVRRRGDSASNVTVSGWVKAKLLDDQAVTLDMIKKQYLSQLSATDNHPPPNQSLLPNDFVAVAADLDMDDYASVSPVDYPFNHPPYPNTNNSTISEHHHHHHHHHHNTLADNHHHLPDQTNSLQSTSPIPRFGRSADVPSDESDPEFDVVVYERSKRLGSMPNRRRNRKSASQVFTSAFSASTHSSSLTSGTSTTTTTTDSKHQIEKKQPPDYFSNNQPIAQHTSRRTTGGFAVSKLSQTAVRHMGHIIQQLDMQNNNNSDSLHDSSAAKRARFPSMDDLPSSTSNSSMRKFPIPPIMLPDSAISFNSSVSSLSNATPPKTQPCSPPSSETLLLPVVEDTSSIPTPSVVVFPLATDTINPDPYTFRASTACSDCSAVIHPNEKHLTCAQCTEAHHIHCTPLYICPPPSTELDVGSSTYTEWKCIFCTFCCLCSKNAPQDQLARCSQCVAVFHLECTSISAELIAADGTILCSQCAKCWSCGVLPLPNTTLCPPTWNRHPGKSAYQCQQCTQYYQNGHFCPVCLKAYSEDDFETPMLGCDGPCGKWIHKACDLALAGTEYDDIGEDRSEYLCPVCRGDPVPDISLIEPGPPRDPMSLQVPSHHIPCGRDGGFGNLSAPHTMHMDNSNPSYPLRLDDMELDSVFTVDSDTSRKPGGVVNPVQLHDPRHVFPSSRDQLLYSSKSLTQPFFDSNHAQSQLDTTNLSVNVVTELTSDVPPTILPTESELAMQAYVEQRKCAFCGQPEMQFLLKRSAYTKSVHEVQDDGVGRLIFIGGNDANGKGTGQWAHSGCLYWSIPLTVPDAVIDEQLVLSALDAVRESPCALCHQTIANVACGHPAGCQTAYHWSCWVRAMYGSGFKSLTQVPPLQGLQGLPNETKKAKRAHIDVYTHDVRCYLHLATAITNLSSGHITSNTGSRKSAHANATVQPTIDECNRVCRMRMAVAHEPTVPLYVSAVPAPRPGKLLTTAPPYDPACLVVGGAVITHIGRLPFLNPNLLIEHKRASNSDITSSNPWLVPVGYTVVRRFWSYKHRGSVTYIIMSRIVDPETEINLSAGQREVNNVPGSAADGLVSSSESVESEILDLGSVGTVVYGELAPDAIVIDDYEVTDNQYDQLVWHVRIADDPDGSFRIKYTGDILPQILARFTHPPFLISNQHHFITRPESFVLLHHPTIVRFIENLPHAAQVTNYPFRFVDPLSLSQIRHAEQALRKGSSRTDPAIHPSDFRCFHNTGVGAKSSSAALPFKNPKPANVNKPNVYFMNHAGVCSGAAPALAHASGTGAPTASSGHSISASWESSVPILIQYQRLKEAEKMQQQVMVRPSKIHGVGLFTVRAFNPMDMVIEYVGEIVSQKVADVRDLINERMGVGTYFFALGHDRIIDATLMGNVARFINHCCDPNCFARIVAPCGGGGEKRVILFAARRIDVGEEVTYDYKFQVELDPCKKVPCFCGVRQCRKYMN